MSELFFGPIAIWFSIPAILGSTFFTLRMGLMLIGGDADADVGVDVDVDFDAGAGVDTVEAGEAADSTSAFKVLSIQAVAAFLGGFGWGGLGALQGAGWSPTVSALVGLASGAGMMWVLGKLLIFIYGLESSGNVELYHALESEGRVYAQIPAAGEGTGRVRVVIGDRARFYRAITEGEALPRDAKVRVVSINDDDSVTVTEA